MANSTDRTADISAIRKRLADYRRDDWNCLYVYRWTACGCPWCKLILHAAADLTALIAENAELRAVCSSLQDGDGGGRPEPPAEAQTASGGPESGAGGDDDVMRCIAICREVSAEAVADWNALAKDGYSTRHERDGGRADGAAECVQAIEEAFGLWEPPHYTVQPDGTLIVGGEPVVPAAVAPSLPERAAMICDALAETWDGCAPFSLPGQEQAAREMSEGARRCAVLIRALMGRVP